MPANLPLRESEIVSIILAYVTKACIILLVKEAVLLPLVSCQVNLTASNIQDGNIACPGEKVVFYCTVNGSQTLSWNSIEYIGSNGAQLEFSSGDPIGTLVNSGVDSRVFANLTHVRNGNSLQSTLHLIPDQNSTVSCLTVNAGSRQSISFTVLRQDPPGTPQNPAATEYPLTVDAYECVLLVSWTPPDNVDKGNVRYIVRTSTESEISEASERQTFASFLSPCEDLVGITVNVTAVDVCNNTGGTTPNFEPSFAKIVTGPPGPTAVTDPSASTTMTNTGPSAPNTELLNSVTAGVISLAVLILLAVIIMVVSTNVICFYVRGSIKRIHYRARREDETPLNPTNSSKTEDTNTLTEKKTSENAALVTKKVRSSSNDATTKTENETSRTKDKTPELETAKVNSSTKDLKTGKQTSTVDPAGTEPQKMESKDPG